ncbi:hypothetical protein SAMN05216353_11215, partial [Halobacillus alkaliphilus]
MNKNMKRMMKKMALVWIMAIMVSTQTLPYSSGIVNAEGSDAEVSTDEPAETNEEKETKNGEKEDNKEETDKGKENEKQETQESSEAPEQEEEKELPEKGKAVEENIINEVEWTKKQGGDLPKVLNAEEAQELNIDIAYILFLPKDHEYGDEAAFTFSIPDLLAVAKESQTDVKGEDGQVVGKYSIDSDQEVKVVFNEDIIGQGVKADITVSAILKEDLEKEKHSAEFKLANNETKTLSFELEAEEKDPEPEEESKESDSNVEEETDEETKDSSNETE